MAQIKNNQVKFGINVGKPQIPLPSFNTQSSTAQRAKPPAVMAPSYGSIGMYNMGIKPPALSQPGKPGTQTPVNTATSNQTTQSVTSPGTSTSPVPTMPPLTGQATPASLSPNPTNSRSSRSNTGNQNNFNGILSSLLGASRPTNEQDRVRREMEEVARGNRTIADEAKRVSDQYGAEISRVGQLGAGAVAGNLSTGSNVVGSGNAAIASQSASARMTALAAGQTASLKGTEQQLSAQQQTLEGLNPSLAASLTQQQTGVTGLSNAANYAQPVQVPYSNQYIDPMSGQSAGGAGLGGYAGYNAAQQSVELAGQYPDAGVQYDPNQTPEQNLQRIQQAIQGSAAYQKSTYGVPGQQSFADATVQQTAQQGYQQSYQTYQDIQKQKTYADNISNQLSGVMSQYGIGENDVRKVNEIQNFIGRQFGDEGQAAFQTALTEAQRAYSSLLTIGGGTVPTEATAASNAILNPNSTIAQINAAIKQLKVAGEERLRTQGTQANTYYNQLQQGSQQSGGGGGDWSW